MQKKTNEYYSFNQYLRERYGSRVHRLSLNAGFTCPNRDGSLGSDGCIFCNEEGFSRFAKSDKSPKDQIRDSIELFKKRYKTDKFIAYFQNASNTYAPPEKLKKIYDVIKDFPEIVGLSISTRPDCIDSEKLDLIESYSKDYEVWIEYGLQTIHDGTLDKIERFHTFKQSLEAINETAKRNIKVGVHIILGLPGETKDDILKTAKTIAGLPVSGVKLHVFHVLKNTKLEKLFKNNNVKLLSMPQYVSLACDFLEHLKPSCVIFRLVSDANQDVLLAPPWINDKEKVLEEIKTEFDKRKTHQGSKCDVKENMCIR